jgi:hypothetical protein
MRYSLRTLFVVVTLFCIAFALGARSRRCFQKAAFHKGHLPVGMQCRNSAQRHGISVESLSPEWLTFHDDCRAAYERVAWNPWLPMLLPVPPRPPVPEDPAEVARREQELDAVRTRLAQQSREKFGVP